MLWHVQWGRLPLGGEVDLAQLAVDDEARQEARHRAAQDALRQAQSDTSQSRGRRFHVGHHTIAEGSRNKVLALVVATLKLSATDGHYAQA
jgi:hypothetical protein